MGVNSIDYETMCLILDHAKIPQGQIIIADPAIQESMDNMYLKTLQMPADSENLWIYSVSHRQTLVYADEKTAAILLKGLSGYIPGMSYNIHYESSKARRYAVPALEKYRNLAVERISYGFAKPHGHYRCAYMIAPFAREVAEKLNEMSQEAFCELVLSSPTFPKLVDFVAEHSIHKGQISREQIRDQYKALILDYYNVFRDKTD